METLDRGDERAPKPRPRAPTWGARARPAGAGPDADLLSTLAVQRAAEAAASALSSDRGPGLRGAVESGLATPGRPLDGGVRSDMESAFGADFGGVRVHTGGAAARSARALQAAAYTTGDEIVFDEGAYAPGTARGRHLIAHELAHVVQQRAGAVDGTDAGDGIAVSDPSDRFERAAEQKARAISRGQRRRGARPPGPGVPSPATVLALQRTAGNAAVAAWAPDGFGDGLSSDAGGGADAHGRVASGGRIQRYSLGEFVSDVEGAAGSVAGAAESAYDAAADAAQGAVDWVADAAGTAALSAAQGLVAAFGGSLVITPTGFVIRIDDISLCDPFEIPILGAPPQGFLWPFPPYPIPIPPDFALVLYGGIALTGTPSMTAHIGPCYLRNISIVFDFFSGTYSANGEWYVGAALSELLVLESTVIGGAVLMLVAPPIPLIWADVGAGLRLFLRGSALGGLQSTQSLTYNSSAGSITFSTLNSLMLGALIEADLDGFVNFSVYGFQICEWVWPLWHWEMGDAIRFDLPITLGYGTGGPPVSVGPITWTPIPYTDIEVVIDRTRPGTTCATLDDIIAELCRLGLLPPSLCPGGGGVIAAPGSDRAPVDLYAFGNSTRPSGPRRSDLHIEPDDTCGPEPGPHSKYPGWPDGASTFSDPDKAPLTGWYYSIASGTGMPSDLHVISDGSDAGGPRDPAHYTIFPIVSMPFQSFFDKFQSLPWKKEKKKK